MNKGNKKIYTHLQIVTKRNRGRITQKAKKVVAYKGWKNGYRRELYLSEYDFLLVLTFAIMLMFFIFRK